MSQTSDKQARDVWNSVLVGISDTELVQRLFAHLVFVANFRSSEV